MTYENLDACKIQGFESVFLIGGLSRRVNVSSQQSRAYSALLELDEKLKAENKSLHGKRVAVIGAGAAGLTAAATAGYLQAQVHLFDKDDMLGGAHKASKHRFLHPNFNEWPFAPEVPVSNLPFLNWITDTGESVAEQLIEDWKNIRGELKGYINEPIHKVRLSSIDGEDYNWQLTFKPKVKRRLPQFEYVFLCLGFGQDASKYLRGSGPSYWNTVKHREYYDLVGNDFSSQPPGDSQKSLYVFGNGDGGINEILQFIYCDFLPGDPQPKLLSFLKDTRIAEELGEIEIRANEELSEIARLTPKQRGSAEKKLGTKVWWEYVEKIQFFEGLPLYEECFGSRNRHLDQPAHLFGRSPTPFDINATAINRTMLAFSVLSKAVRYHRLESETEGGSGRGKHTVDVSTSRSNWEKPGRLMRETLIITSKDYRTARFGPGDVYKGITINGAAIETGPERRNIIRMNEPDKKRARGELDDILSGRDSMYRSDQLGKTYAQSFNTVLARRFKAGFSELYLSTPDPTDDTDALFVLNFRFAGSVRARERAEWKAALPKSIFGQDVELKDLEHVEGAELLD